MNIESLLNHEDIFPAMTISVPSMVNDRVGKNRVERSCPACGKKNHIRTTNCKACATQLRVSPSKPPTRASRNAGPRTSSRIPKSSVAAILNSSPSTMPWSSGKLDFATDMFAPESRRATETSRGKYSSMGKRQDNMDFDSPSPGDSRASAASRTVRNILGSSRVVQKALRGGNGRRGGDRTSRPCRNCSTQNHIRVTLCSKCRRSLRGAGS